MAKKFNQVYAFVVMLIVVPALLAACGDSPTTVPATTAAIASTTAAATVAALTTAAPSTTAAGTSVAATTAVSGATTAASNATTAAGTTVAAGSTTGAAASCTRLNLNSLTEAQLTATIPNFPNRMIREFFEYRPYASITVYRKEIGKYVSADQVAQWEKYVFVPVKPNEADTETLKQLPGVDDTTAAALAAGRPYASNDTFLKTLATKVSAEQAAAAACYLGA